MKIKKFTARTFSEALELVKKELSQDAIILATEEKKGLRPHVEVTAAVDYEANTLRNADCELRKQIQKPRSEIRNPKSEILTDRESFRPAIANAPVVSDDGAGDLRREINSLRAMIESMKNSGYEVSLPAKKRTILNFLRERSIREEFALRLCDKTTDVNEIPLLLSSDIKVKRDAASRKAVMFIGPTGVGKTTTVAKLAAQAVKAGRKAAIINLDTYRIGAVEQVRIYSHILGIPLATASTAAEFKSSLQKFAGSRDVVFVDTMGRNPRDGTYLNDMTEICSIGIPLELHLLMSANADDECMIEAYRTYRQLPIDYIGFSKIDEAVRFGTLYNLLLIYQKPVAYLTTGQRVPGNIEQATVKRLAGLIMSKECAVC
jgi:flagellar biosynthesis protein FlhF